MSKLSIICVAYKRYHAIKVLIECLLCQTNPDWELLIIHDGEDTEHYNIVFPYTEQYANIKYWQTPIRYNDFGHTLRDLGIQQVTGDYILITNDDNYYVPKFVELMLEPQADFIYCDMVHNHNRPESSSGGTYGFFKTHPAYCQIDIGCFIIKREIAQAVGFKHRINEADGLFVEDILRTYPNLKIVKIPKVLYVHN
jgi:glycosyltransferase involved in cell wall biosynthesis